MSPTVLFIVGSIVFAITVYGCVMAGGLMLTRSEMEQHDDRGPALDRSEEHVALPLNVKY